MIEVAGERQKKHSWNDIDFDDFYNTRCQLANGNKIRPEFYAVEIV